MSRSPSSTACGSGRPGPVPIFSGEGDGSARRKWEVSSGRFLRSRSREGGTFLAATSGVEAQEVVHEETKTCRRPRHLPRRGRIPRQHPFAPSNRIKPRGNFAIRPLATDRELVESTAPIQEPAATAALVNSVKGVLRIAPAPAHAVYPFVPDPHKPPINAEPAPETPRHLGGLDWPRNRASAPARESRRVRMGCRSWGCRRKRRGRLYSVWIAGGGLVTSRIR
jgi:hypothetical protein